MIFSKGGKDSPAIVSIEISAQGEAYMMIDRIPVLKLTNDGEIKRVLLPDVQAYHLDELGIKINTDDNAIRISEHGSN